jgi:pimeloyl-ACP methyl ester carboxylesterase
MNWQTDHGSIFVYDGGERYRSGAPTLCFIHGAAMDHTVWTLFARYWAKNGYNVAAIDLPGHGLSDGTPLTTIVESAGLVTALIEQHLPPGDVCWVGHSMGSLIALECAAIAKQTSALVMMGTAFPMAVGSALLDSAKANEHLAIDIVSLFGHSYGSQLGGNPVAGIHAQTLAERLMEQAAEHVMYTDLNACNTYERGLEAAAAVQCPASLILGELDRMTPMRAAEALKNALTDVTVTTLPDCGHMMMTEKPEQTHQALTRCLRSVALPVPVKS